MVYVAPITHSPPATVDDALELSGSIRRRLALDDSRSWVVATEFNAFRWPGTDLALLPPQLAPSEIAYGSLPGELIEKLIALFRKNTALGRVRAIKRGE